MKIHARHVVFFLALAWQAHAIAQNAESSGVRSAVGQAGYVDLLAGLAYTDNALLSSTQKKSDGIGALGFTADYVRHGNLSLDLLGSLARLQYLDHSFAGTYYGQFFGSGVLGKPTDFMQWELADSFGEEMNDPLAAPNPQNLQTINYVSTGPQFNLHFGLANRLTLFGRTSRTTYQRSPFDSQSYEGGAEFFHALSGASAVSLRASDMHTKYLESAAVQNVFGGMSNFNIRRVAITYRGRFVRTDILLRAGYNTIQFSGSSARGAPLYDLQLSRRISPFSTVYIDAQQLYSTNGMSLGSQGAGINVQVGASQNPGYAVAQPFNERSAGAGWLFRRARTSFSLTGTYGESVYDQTGGVTQQYNQRNEGVAAILGRQLSQTTRLQLRVEGYWDRYSHLDAQTRRQDEQLSFSKRFARTMISFYVERVHQGGSPGSSGFYAGSFNDDRVGMYVTYDVFGSRSSRPQLQTMPGMQPFRGGF